MANLSLSPGAQLAWQLAGDLALHEKSLILPRHLLYGLCSAEKLQLGPGRDAKNGQLVLLAHPELVKLNDLAERYGFELAAIRRALRLASSGGPVDNSPTVSGQRVSRSAATKQIFEAASQRAIQAGSSDVDLLGLLRATLQAADPEIEAAVAGQKPALLNALRDMEFLQPDTVPFSISLDSKLRDLDAALPGAASLQIAESIDASVPVETQHRPDSIDQLATLAELTWEWGTRGQVDVMLQKSLDALLSMLGKGERGVILVRDSRDAELLLKACAPMGAPPMISTTSAKKAMADQKGFVWKRGDDLTLSQKESKIERGMYVPLVVNGEAIGVICIDCFCPQQVFSRGDLLLVTSFAHQLALAIANHEMQLSLKRNTEVLERLLTNFSPKVRTHLLHRAEMGRLRLGGEKSTVSVLCADIRGFARLTASMPSDEIVSLLNDYFAPLTDCIFRNDGTIDKFVGDAILSVFGSPEQDPRHFWNAVLAGMDMQVAAREVSQRRASRGDIACEIGIGIHTGEVLHGFIGSPERMEFTVIGDAVNRASRYCDGAKGGEVLVSPDIYQRIWNAVYAQQIEIPTKHEGSLVAYRVERIRSTF